VVGSRIIFLSFWPTGVPPGSRVTMWERFVWFRWLAIFFIWVDFPEPSIPSKVMKWPFWGIFMVLKL